MQRVRLSAGEVRVELSPEIGGSVAVFAIERGGERVHLFRPAPERFTDPLEGGCFPLVPYCNRIREGRFTCDGRTIVLPRNMPGQKHPLHGDGWRAPWAVEEASESACTMIYHHAPGPWPWRYEARQRFEADGEGMTVTLSCRNASDSRMPCGLGLHPYFPCDGETVLDAPVEWVWTIDEEIMPVERIAAEGGYHLNQRRFCAQDLDNGYEGWSGEAMITWPPAGVALTFSTKDASRFQVYSPEEGGLFAAEPVTNVNAALNWPQEKWEEGGLVMLAPGAETVLTTRFHISASPVA